MQLTEPHSGAPGVIIINGGTQGLGEAPARKLSVDGISAADIRRLIAELGETGMQVHRSHWISRAHVRRIVGTAGEPLR